MTNYRNLVIAPLNAARDKAGFHIHRGAKKQISSKSCQKKRRKKMKKLRNLLVLVVAVSMVLAVIPIVGAEEGNKVNINTATMEKLIEPDKIGPKYRFSW